jgi:hypothetical protein
MVGEMTDNNDGFFPYPADPARRVGSIIADMILIGLAAVFVIMIFPTFLR